MGRKRKGLPIHGWLIIDKPLGITSNGVVGAVRRATQAQKVGHGGTLDPLATGILPLALGEATKTVSYAMDGAKIYRVTVCFGEARNTDDAEGVVVETSDHRPTDAEISAILPQFTGDIEQVPPAFSAIKVDGQRAYKLARDDQEVTLAARTIRIDGLALVDRPDVDHATFEITSGKGAYMRALARDISKALGTVGYVSELRRLAVGPFSEKDAISLENIETLGHSAALEEMLLPVETVLDDIPALALTETEARQMRHGQAISVLSVANRTPLKQMEQGDVVLTMSEGKPVALAKIVGGEVRPLRVLNL